MSSAMQFDPGSVPKGPDEISEISLQSVYPQFGLCPYPVLKTDHNWAVNYVNPAAKRVLFAGEAPVGRNYWSVFSDRVEPDSMWQSHHYLALENNRPPPEFVQFFKSPLNLWMAIAVRPAKDGIFLFFRDITTEKNCADALQNHERLASLGRLTSGIVHEILNPLESVTNLLYLALETNELAPVKEYIQLAEQEINRASLIVSQTLRFNRSTALTSIVNCDALLRDILLLQKARLASRKIKADTSEVRPVQVHCNEIELRQIAVNLISNAIDAVTPDGGRLVIRARKSIRSIGAGVVITVADNGTGMSSETLKRSFDPFFTTKKDQGNGLGLWISRDLAIKYGGTLKARSSQKAGKSGSVFQLFIPDRT